MTGYQYSTHPRLYYGWVVVGVIVIVSIAAAAGTLAVNGIFLKPITEEFGWSRATYSGATGIGTVLGAGLAMGAGVLVDRWGPKWLMVTGFIVLGITYIGLAYVSDLTQFYVLQIAGRAAHMGVISVGLLSTIPKWFVAARGKAVALGSLGNAIGIVAFPFFAQILINVAGWRFAAATLGWVLMAIAMPPVIMFLRRRPEDIGLNPYGIVSDDEKQPNRAPAPSPMEEKSMKIALVLRHPSFYLITFGTTAGFMAFTATFFHIVPYLTDEGIDPVAAVTVVAVWSACAGVGTIVTGFVLDRYDSRVMLALQLAVGALSYGLLLLLSSVAALVIWAVVYGFTQGALVTTQQVIYANYYGRNHLGSIRGFVMPAFALGNAAGATGSALIFDLSGSYIPVFWGFAIINLFGVVAAILAKPPNLRV